MSVLPEIGLETRRRADVGLDGDPIAVAIGRQSSIAAPPARQSRRAALSRRAEPRVSPHASPLAGGRVGKGWADMYNLPAYVLRYTVLTLAALGLLSVWDAHGDGRMSPMAPFLAPGKDPERVSSAACAAKNVDEAARWQGLSAAIAILDDVNPDVAAWLHERRKAGAIVFSDEYSGQQDRHGMTAKFDHLRRTLVVYRGLFDEKDGEIAAILCHEYRHSRQNVAKLIRCAVSLIVSESGDRSILENDALLYEQEARLAIFRR